MISGQVPDAGHSGLWREWLVDQFGLRAAPACGIEQAVVGRKSLVTLGDVGVYRMAGSTQTLDRSASTVRSHPSEALKTILMTRGSAVVEQSAAQVPVGPGQLALYDTSRPYRIMLLGPWEVLVMTVPRESLGLVERDVLAGMRRPISAQSGSGRLLSRFLGGVTSVDTGPDVRAAQHIRDAGVALLAGTLVASPPAGVVVGPDSVRAHIVSYIEDHLADPGLSTASIASAHHMAPRSLQRLFAGEERTVSTLIRDYRLEAIRRDLLDPRMSRRTIAAIAARWCVIDQSWLSRNFRAAFGMSPSQYRRAGAHPVPPSVSRP